VRVAGFGFRAAATTTSLHVALDMARGAWPVTHLATLIDKAPALADLAVQLGLPVIALAPDQLVGLRTLTHSIPSQTARGIGSVAEACALAACYGRDAHLLGPRVLSQDRMATCAIAQGVCP